MTPTRLREVKRTPGHGNTQSPFAVAAGRIVLAAVLLVSGSMGHREHWPVAASGNCPEPSPSPLLATPQPAAPSEREEPAHCLPTIEVADPDDGREIGGLLMVEDLPDGRSFVTWASVVMPSQPIYDAAGRQVNDAFSCGPPFVVQNARWIDVTFDCHSPRDLPVRVVGLSVVEARISRVVDNHDQVVVVDRCEHRDAFGGFPTFGCSVARGDGTALGGPKPTPNLSGRP